MEYIRVTKDNIEKEHICCAISNKFDWVPFVYFHFYLNCFWRLKENIGMIHVRECFAYVLFQEFYGVMSYV